MDGEIVRISAERVVSVELAHELLVVFAEPPGVTLSLGDLLRFPASGPAPGVPVRVANLTQGNELTIRLAAGDVHDLRKPGRHGASRTPSSTERPREPS